MKEKARMEAEAIKKANEMANASAAARAEYEKNEAARLVKEKENAIKQKQSDMDKTKAQLEQEKIERQKIIDERSKNQSVKDKKDLADNKE